MAITLAPIRTAAPVPSVGGEQIVRPVALAIGLAMLAAAAFASLLLNLDADKLRHLGYAGVFVTAAIGSASIALLPPRASARWGQPAVSTLTRRTGVVNIALVRTSTNTTLPISGR